MAKKSTLTADKIKEAIANKFSCKQAGGTLEWVILPEFRASSFNTGKRDYSGYTFIDMLVIGGWNKTRSVQAFEIKISRSDFLKDVQDFQGKQGPVFRNSTHFWYICPSGLIQPDEVPEGCGLYWVSDTCKLMTKKIAPVRQLETVEVEFLQSLMSRLAKMSEPFPYKLKYLNTEITTEVLEDLAKKEYVKNLQWQEKYEIEQQAKALAKKEAKVEDNLVYILNKCFGYGKYDIRKMSNQKVKKFAQDLKRLIDAITDWRSFRGILSDLENVTEIVKMLKEHNHYSSGEDS